jgi:hypothetical protein
MKRASRNVAFAAIVAIAVIAPAAAHADDQDRANQANRYVVTKLTSNIAGAANTDNVLQNAWGVTFTPAIVPFGFRITPPGVRRFTMAKEYLNLRPTRQPCRQ